MKSTKQIFIVWLVAVAPFISSAQQLLFETYKINSGLSANEVLCLYEDHKGYLWIGTRGGLNRFDGIHFTQFKNNPADSNSLSGNVVVDIMQDAENVFWIATKDGGLTRYDDKAPEGKQFKQFRNIPDNKNSIATNRLICLYDYSNDYLLIGAENVCAIFLNKKTLQFSYWNPLMKTLAPAAAKPQPEGRMSWMQHIADAQPGYFFASLLHNGELIKVSKKTGQRETIHMGSEDVLSIRQFLYDGQAIWMSAWNPGLFVQKDLTQLQAQKFFDAPDLLMQVSAFDKNNLLVCTRGSGLYMVNKQTGSAYAYQKNILEPHSLPSNKVNCALRDSRGIVWIGTEAGLCKYDKRAWLFKERPFCDAQLECAILNIHRFDNSVCVSTSKGLFTSDAEQKNFALSSLQHNGIEIIPDGFYPLSDGRTLVGSENGFYEWDEQLQTIKPLPVFKKGVDLTSAFYAQGVYEVKDFAEQNDGVWMAVRGYGLAYYDFKTSELYEYLNDAASKLSIGSNLTGRVIIDKTGDVWITTVNGLYQRKKSTPLSKNEFVSWRNIPGDSASLPSNVVNDVWCDANNIIWCTTNAGLCAIEKGKCKTFVPNNPLSSGNLFGIYEDARQRIWMISSNGLEIFDKRRKKFFHLDVNDGSSNTALCPWFSNETNGSLSFTAGNLVFSFKPYDMLFNEQFPSMYLAGFSVFGKNLLPQALKDHVQLRTRQNFVDIRLSAQQFTQSSSVRFAYRLDGLEDRWNTTADGNIRYTGLHWGYYKLMARVSNPSGQFGPEITMATFTIATPFYATWWFIGLCILLTAAIVYAIYKYRINQLLALQRVRNKIARDLHDDIGSTLGSISFFSEAALQQLEKNKTDTAGKMMHKIGETSREMIESMSDIVWSVNPQNDTVKHLITRMKTFAGDLIASKNILLHFENDKASEDVKLSMEQRKNVFLIFKETIYNSVKYAECQNIYVSIKSSKTLQIEMRDDGKGFDINNYVSKNGNGIKNMRFRAEEAGAAYHIESGAGKGTLTVLSI